MTEHVKIHRSYEEVMEDRRKAKPPKAPLP